MITNFEEITSDLSEDEKKLLPMLVKSFNGHVGKENAVKGFYVVNRVNDYFKKEVITEVRLRKLVNLIRRNGIIPLIATSNGYYVTVDQKEIINQMKSLQQRADAILAAKNGLEKFITEV